MFFFNFSVRFKFNIFKNIFYHIFQCNYIMGFSKKLRTNQSNVYWFSLVDQHGVQLDLNGLNMVFTLLLFKKDDTADMIRGFLKLSLLDS